MKSALISYQKKLSNDFLLDFKRKLAYDHFFILTHNCKVESEKLKKLKKFTIIECTRREIPKKIDHIFNDPKNSDLMIMPYFKGIDADTKYSIKIYNKMFNSKIDANSFRLKSNMNNFLGKEIVQKKSLKYSYHEIIKLKYQKIAQKIGQQFILKPTNAAASLLNFKISSIENFHQAKQKLQKKYQYIIEEYLEGNLYSVDFYCNGEDIFLLCFVREIPFLEIMEKFSQKYLDKYQTPLTTDFLHFLPISYSLNLKKITNFELEFIKKIGQKLIENKYRGFIHLEYKVKRKDKKIGFIEWGARMGGKRDYFIEKMHRLRAENIPFKILFKKDLSRFEKKKGIYYLKGKDIDENLAFIKTNVIEKTHVLKILKKIPKFLNISFERFLKEFMWDKWKIKVRDINFSLSNSSEGFLYPFYQRSDAKLTYIMEMKEKSFQKFLSKKYKILEHLVFHDYKN